MGTYACDGADVSCNAPVVVGTTETCDGKDNDCDGTIDNGVQNACGGCEVLAHARDASCEAGRGACTASGRYVCDGKTQTVCNAVPKPPSKEICGNGVDDDCDGVFSNGCTCYVCESIGGGTYTTWAPSPGEASCQPLSAAEAQSRCSG